MFAVNIVFQRRLLQYTLYSLNSVAQSEQYSQIVVKNYLPHFGSELATDAMYTSYKFLRSPVVDIQAV